MGCERNKTCVPLVKTPTIFGFSLFQLDFLRKVMLRLFYYLCYILNLFPAQIRTTSIRETKTGRFNPNHNDEKCHVQHNQMNSYK